MCPPPMIQPRRYLFALTGLLLAGMLPLLGASSRVATPAIDTILYGASYYHEYMPEERLDKDIQLMKEAGITLIRLGESTWSSWEPRDGVFEFAWMDRVLDRLHGAGIKVVMGTPTYSIPPWLYKKHPEILATTLGEKKSYYGPRQNMDITHPAYLFHSERVIRQIMRRYKDHPGIIGYQIDNETGPYGTAGPSVQRAFAGYLKEKHGTTARLNEIWGLTYWGQLVNGWDELPPRDGILNPGYKLDWERFQQKIVTDFLAWQAGIVREYVRPGQFVTHNFVGGVRTNIDQFAIAKHLDIAAVNPYHGVQDDLDGLSISLSGDLCRSLKQQNYFITETNAPTIGWDSKTQFPPYDGQLRLNAYSHIASGANMVAYWHWHSLHYGQETYWKGVLSHDLEPNRAYKEVTRIGQELKKHGPELANLRKRHQAALLYSIDSYHGIDFMPFDDRVNYLTVLHQMYKALYQSNTGVDFVFPESENFADYKVIVVPPLYVASDALLNRLAEYVKGGGHLVVAFKSGFTNEHSTVRWQKAPGPLREAAGFYYQEFSNLKKPLALKGDPFLAGEQNQVSVWTDMLIPESAKTLATYEHPFFGNYPALTRNQYGKGTLTYQGAFLSDEIQKQVLLEVLEMAKLTGPDQKLPVAVKVKHGVDQAGRVVRYYLNYSGETQRMVYPYGTAVNVLTGKKAGPSSELIIGPWDLAILREQ
jgi:beta-galactosidase